MIQVPFPMTINYIECPAGCDMRFAVSHLEMGCKTRWVCDKCGIHFDLHVQKDGIDTNILESRTKKTEITLRCEGPVSITVEGHRVIDPKDPKTQEEYLELTKDFYEEHTCPVNYLRVVKEVFDAEGAADPHGIFEVVKVEDVGCQRS